MKSLGSKNLTNLGIPYKYHELLINMDQVYVPTRFLSSSSFSLLAYLISYLDGYHKPYHNAVADARPQNLARYLIMCKGKGKEKEEEEERAFR